jgi:hypothetical protein
MKTEIFWGPKTVKEWNLFLSIEIGEEFNLSHLSIEVYPRGEEIARRFQSTPHIVDNYRPASPQEYRLLKESGIALSVRVAHPEVVLDLLREYQTLVSLPYKLEARLPCKMPFEISRDVNDPHVVWLWMLVEDADYILHLIDFLRNRYTYIPLGVCQIIIKLLEQCLALTAHNSN